MNLTATFGAETPVVGMVHLPALPGAPGFDGDRAAIRERAVADARALAEGGVDAVLVENYGDAPFYPDDVPKVVVAELTAAVGAVDDAVDLPVGVNVLRNDVEASLSVAGATGGRFVRANQHVGARLTDQGIVEGRAHETVRLRDRIDADAAILADVAVKHSAPLADRPLAELVADTVERGRADGLVVSGPGTGDATDEDDLRAVAAAAPAETPVFVGSGVTAGNAAALLSVADGAIVGTAFKTNGETTNPVDGDRVAALVEQVEAVR
ncbi:BtpA/SgcQ family protein [Haloarculaceae archaeon H-GB2-1]|nr:BtpA/SgcQ family protein [Haloarculaceae archaeon H-GB1-1]MEA5386115.1 BtpA/SgcQ family protein [Haloarculaceae archaeon H-GB11]MEA5407622.1 BtpA/SgcQ family protein [Haloarculaceae archaeon H-GB2-1]